MNKHNYSNDFSSIKFSITIPSFKIIYLEECIKSILLQSYTNFELIIIDDCSPDDLFSIVTKFNDPRISYYRNTVNIGALDVVDNWNIGLKYAKGDYIICMGDDDKLLPNCLEEYYNLINKFPNLNVYQSFSQIINEYGQIIDFVNALPEFESSLSLMWHNFRGRKQFIGNILFDTKVLKNNGGFYKLPFALSSDEITTYIAADLTGIANSQLPLFQYRKNKYSITNNGNPFKLLDSVNLEEEWYINRLNEPTLNEYDNVYRQCLLNEMPNHFKKKRRSIIKFSINKKSIFNIFIFLYYKKKYNLSFKDFLIVLGSKLI
jgi:glycosyltransferase involved in cell wall biosynthesis